MKVNYIMQYFLFSETLTFKIIYSKAAGYVIWVAQAGRHGALTGLPGFSRLLGRLLMRVPLTTCPGGVLNALLLPPRADLNCLDPMALDLEPEG
jgi:hypothetical protein